MESSSDSFAWTDASNDSTDSGDMAVNNKSGNKYEKESKPGKDKLNQHLNHEINQDVKRKDRKRKLEKVIIKSEVETDDADADVPKKKHKTNNVPAKMNGLHDKLQDYESYDESFLNKKVKEEHTFGTPSPVKNKNKYQSTELETTQLKKIKRESESNYSYNYGEETNPGHDTSEANISSDKKKKKKSKKRERESRSIDDNNIIEDKFGAEETVGDNYNFAHNSSKKVPREDESFNHYESTVINEDSKISFYNKSLGDVSYSKDFTSPCDVTFDTSIIHNSLSILDKTNDRTSKLSDKNTVESENNLDTATEQVLGTKNNEQSSKFKRFLKANSDLKPFFYEPNIDSELTLDDDIWVLKCSHDIDINAFKNKKIVLDRKCKVKIDSQTYEGSMVEGNGKMAILSVDNSKCTIKNVTVNSTIHLRKRIPKIRLQEDNIMTDNQTNFIPLPETKCRHPLFGAHYKKAIKIPAAVSERLKSLPNEQTPKDVEKKRKKKHKKDKETADVQLDVVASPKSHIKLDPKLESESEVYIPKNKKKKKRKHSDNEDKVQRKSKKIKRNLESAEAWESEKAIEENLFLY